jgi:hypothetical protein
MVRLNRIGLRVCLKNSFPTAVYCRAYSSLVVHDATRGMVLLTDDTRHHIVGAS